MNLVHLKKKQFEELQKEFERETKEYTVNRYINFEKMNPPKKEKVKKMLREMQLYQDKENPDNAMFSVLTSQEFEEYLDAYMFISSIMARYSISIPPTGGAAESYSLLYTDIPIELRKKYDKAELIEREAHIRVQEKKEKDTDLAKMIRLQLEIDKISSPFKALNGSIDYDKVPQTKKEEIREMTKLVEAMYYEFLTNTEIDKYVDAQMILSTVTAKFANVNGELEEEAIPEEWKIKYEEAEKMIEIIHEELFGDISARDGTSSSVK